MKVRIFNCDCRGMFQIHAHDCADCAKVAKSGNRGFPLGSTIEEHGSPLSIAKSIYSDQIKEGMAAEDGVMDLDIKPCVKFPKS